MANNPKKILEWNIDEWADWRTLCDLRTMLSKRLTILRLHLPSREKLLEEITVEIDKIEQLPSAT